MQYLTLRFEVPSAQADKLTEALETLGAMSVTVENAGPDEYYEAAYPAPPTWKRVALTGLFPGAENGHELLSRCSSVMGRVLQGELRQVEDREWERVWMDRYRPRTFRGGLSVYPTWMDPSHRVGEHIVLDPGLAFGTGEHPTTAMCLDWISDTDLSGKSVIDYGTGSGILAIACLKRGASFAWGVDVDTRALTTSRVNAETNGVGASFQAIGPEQLPFEKQVDVVIANILSGVIIELASLLSGHVKSGGRLLLTGLLETQINEVASKFDSLFEFQVERDGDWCLLLGRRV